MKSARLSVIAALAAVVLSIHVASAEEVTVRCVTPSFPTTTFLVEPNGESTLLRVIHHHGTRYMPISNGTITPDDMPRIAEKAKVLQSFGDEFQVEFATSECEKRKPPEDGFYCVRHEPFQIGSVTLDDAYFTVFGVTELFMGFEFKRNDAALYVRKDGTEYVIAMPYYEPGCQFE